MSTISDARALLQRVREGATPGRWDVMHTEHPMGETDIAIDGIGYLGTMDTRGDALLASLMTDPELLDAIDGMLRQSEAFPDDVFRPHAERIASALVQQGTAMGIVQPAPGVEP